MTKPLKIIFMGTPDFAAVALKALIGSAHDVVAVYSQPPRPKGRGHHVQKSAVHEVAESHNIPVFMPKSLKSVEEQEIFGGHNADVAVVAAYGLLLPQAILDAPNYGCLNIHASLLPRWRGASPIQRSIWAGDAQSGVTIMQMDKGLDTGDMIAKVAVDLDDTMSASSLHDILAEKGAALTLNVLDGIAANGKPAAQKQDEFLVTYAHLLTKEDGKIDWNKSAQEIDRQIRALTQWPSVYTGNDSDRIKIISAVVLSEKSSESAGFVLSRDGLVVCGGGSVLKILKLQPAGKQAMDFASAVNGGYVKIGQILL